MVAKDYTGLKINMLTFIKFSHKKNNRRYWSIKCDCGNEIIREANSIVQRQVYSCGCYRIDLDNMIGKRFGKLEVLNNYQEKNNKIYWQCKCSCGNEKYILAVSLRRGHAKSCGCVNKSRGRTNKHWKGYQDISGEYWHYLKRNAKKRNIKFKITMEQVWDIWIKQDKKCRLSGLDLSFGFCGKDARSTRTASLDRIDSDKDYTIDNVQWVHKDINKIKSFLTQKYFIELCNLVSKNTS